MKKEQTLKDVLLKMVAKKEVKEQICEMLLNEVAKGNLKAVDLIREMTGEKYSVDVDQIEQVTNIKIEVIDAKGAEN